MFLSFLLSYFVSGSYKKTQVSSPITISFSPKVQFLPTVLLKVLKKFYSHVFDKRTNKTLVFTKHSNLQTNWLPAMGFLNNLDMEMIETFIFLFYFCTFSFIFHFSHFSSCPPISSLHNLFHHFLFFFLCPPLFSLLSSPTIVLTHMNVVQWQTIL